MPTKRPTLQPADIAGFIPAQDPRTLADEAFLDRCKPMQLARAFQAVNGASSAPQWNTSAAALLAIVCSPYADDRLHIVTRVCKPGPQVTTVYDETRGRFYRAAHAGGVASAFREAARARPLQVTLLNPASSYTPTEAEALAA